jgi:urea transport system permease protein
VVNTAKSLFSENFPQLWLYCMGGLFILVVVLMPNGLAGLFNGRLKQWFAAMRKRSAERSLIQDAKPATPAA